MDVSIIFVNYKTKDLTINAINSVIEKTEGIEYEIFVVDNNSQDGSIEVIAQKFPNINIIKNQINAGFGAANNLAIKQAKGKYIFCLNTDTLLINNAIKIMFDFMEKDESQNVGVCGGYLVNEHNVPTICGGNFPSLTDVIWKMGFRNIFPNIYKNYCVTLNSDDSKYLRNIEYISGADIFFRKSVLDEVGIFDEKFFMYYEETDLCKRISDRGYNIEFIKDAKIMHLEQKSSSDNIARIKISKKSEFYYFKKHHKNQRSIIKWIYILLYFLNGYLLNNQEKKEIMKFVINL